MGPNVFNEERVFSFDRLDSRVSERSCDSQAQNLVG